MTPGNLVYAVECSERIVLSCLEPVSLCWRRFGRYFSQHLAKSDGWSADFMHWCRTCVETVLTCDWLFVSLFLIG